MILTDTAPCPVVKISSFEDLKSVLLLQRIVSHQAQGQLLAIAEKFPAPDNDDSEEVKYASDIITEELKLLHSYAARPTLSEFQQRPELYGAYMWGATFGVAKLMGAMVMQHLQSPKLSMTTINRFMLVRLLQEIQEGRLSEASMYEEIIRTANVSIEGSYTKEEQKKIVKQMLIPYLEGMMLLLVEYDLVDSEESHYTLTPIGKRVLMHLVDARRFIEEIAAAHAKYIRDTSPTKSS